MIFDPDFVVHECADLSVGDQIYAWQGGHLFHTGIITDCLPALGLFWSGNLRWVNGGLWT